MEPKMFWAAAFLYTVVVVATGKTCPGLNDDQICSKVGDTVCTGNMTKFGATRCPNMCDTCDAAVALANATTQNVSYSTAVFNGKNCSNSVPDCDDLGIVVCMPPLQPYGLRHCGVKCEECVDDPVDETSTTTTGVPTTSPLQTTKPPEICGEKEDDPICRAMGTSICNATYNLFASRRCRFFCEFCATNNNTVMNNTMTPTNKTEVPDGRVCYNDDPECADIGDIVCQSPLDIYGRAHCELFCGFCTDNSTDVITTPVPPTAEKTTTSSKLNKTEEYCAEKIDDSICRALGMAVCQNHTEFAKVKCRFMCEYCAPSVNYTGEVPITTPRTPISSSIGQTCYDDDPECSDIGPSVCESPLDMFGRVNCARYCKFCTLETQPTPASTSQQTTTIQSPPELTSGPQQTTVPDQTSTAAVCVNDPDASCERLGRQVCEGPLIDFGRLKCPKFCNLCLNTESTTKRTTVVAPTPLPTGEPEPNFFNDCNTTAEVVFVLDSSSSVGEANFQMMREFTQNVTLRLKQEYNSMNVTVITYSNVARVALKLTDSMDIGRMLALEANITYDHGGTNTHTALDLMMQQFSGDVNNPKVGIVITDGTSFEPDKTAQSAHSAKMNGIVLFVVGIGDDINPHEMTAISSKPDSNYLFQVSDFKALRAIAEQFQAKNCTTPAPPTTRTTTSAPTTTNTEPPPVTTTEAATQTVPAVTDAQNTPTVIPPVTLPTVVNTVKSSIATVIQTPVTRPTMPTVPVVTDKPIVVTGVATAEPHTVTKLTTVMTPVQPVQTGPTVSKITNVVSVNPVVTDKVTSTEKTVTSETQRPPAVTQIVTETTPSAVTNPPSPDIKTTEAAPLTTVTLAPPARTTTSVAPPQTPAFTTTPEVTMVATTTEAQPPTQSPATQSPATQAQITTTSAEPPKTPELITMIQTDPTTASMSTTQAATPPKLTTTTAEPPTRSQETSSQPSFTTTEVQSQTQPPLTTTKAQQQTEPQTTETTTSATTKAPMPTPEPETTTKVPIETPEPMTTTQPPTQTPEPTRTTKAPPTQTPEPPTTATKAPPVKTTEPTTTTKAPPIQTPEPPTTTTKAPPIQTPEPPTTTTKVPPVKTTEPTTTTQAPPIQTPEPTTTTKVPPIQTPEPTTTTESPPIQTTEPTATTTAPMPTPVPETTTKVPIETPKPMTTTQPPTQTPEPTTATKAPPIQTPEPPTTTSKAPPVTTPEPTTTTKTTPIQTPKPPTTTTKVPPIQTTEPTTTTKATMPTPEPITTTQQPIQTPEPIITTSSTEKPLTTSQLTQQPTESTTTLPKSTTTASCIAKVADVVFVVDASGSIGIDNFDKVKGFIKDIVRTFDVDPRYTQVALVEFSTNARIEFKLNEHSNLTDLIAAIDSIHYSGGGTMTSDALELMRGPGYEGERLGAPDISIVITDGLSKYPPITKIQADRAKAEGITMFSIGIGNQTDPTELTGLASGPQFQFQVGEFGALSKIDQVVAHLACGVILPTNPYIRLNTTTPTPTPGGCVDLVDCSGYSKDSCSDYEPYARGHCAKTCGFCGTEVERPCKDAITNCGSYGTYMCFDITQYQWVDKNCRKFCGFCGNKTEVLIESSTVTTPVITTQAGCVDERRCQEYNADMCTNPEFRVFAEKNCRRYCGYCLADIHTVTPHTTGSLTCPAWVLPKECRLEHEHNNCCPVPICTDGFKLLVKRA